MSDEKSQEPRGGRLHVAARRGSLSAWTDPERGAYNADGYAFANAKDPAGNSISISSRAYRQRVFK